MRPDGRESNDELRPVHISRSYLKYPEGSALIRMGDTMVICTATVQDAVPPFLKGEGRGWVTSEYAMLPRATEVRTQRESRGKISGRSVEIQRLIGRSLRSVVDLAILGERTIWLDCDVIQADGGTRSAAITGSFVALVDALYHLKREGVIERLPIKDYLAAVSVGEVEGELRLDLCYAEDSMAGVDMNVVMTGSGKLVEIQGTAEGHPFGRTRLDHLLDLAALGVEMLIHQQKQVLQDIAEELEYAMSFYATPFEDLLEE
ncbi:MAG: ribonuclease PH [Firmicutes bacterium]|nr:ribonuclease PH [Bacillota bacterium]